MNYDNRLNHQLRDSLWKQIEAKRRASTIDQRAIDRAHWQYVCDSARLWSWQRRLERIVICLVLFLGGFLAGCWFEHFRNVHGF